MKVTLRSFFGIPNKAAAARAFRRAVLRQRNCDIVLRNHLEAAYAWTCTAQDATPDGGVAGCYNLVRGWGASYPETTGYIVPTFLTYAAAMKTPQARERALRMADWEIDVQLPEGAVRSGMLDVKAGPAVFNTGQVLSGWVSAYRASGDERYARAAANACKWLIQIQDDDGAWRRHLSVVTTSRVQTYNVRAAWGLALAGEAFAEPKWINAAIRNCDWALAQQMENGWFTCNTFTEGDEPLLHTIGYVLEGLLGVGELLGRERYIRAVLTGIAPLMDIYRRNGGFKGRYDRNWNSTVSWRCLTGEAQVALVLARLARMTGDASYMELCRAIVEGVARLQDIESPYPETCGGIAGSEPIWGGYGPFNYLNWAPKFFMDALLLVLFNVDVQGGEATHATRRNPVAAA